jgi:hypothetical protein
MNGSTGQVIQLKGFMLKIELKTMINIRSTAAPVIVSGYSFTDSNVVIFDTSIIR